MSTNPIWIAGYGGTPTGGASPVWIASYGAAVSGAAEAWIAGYGGTPAVGASPVWIAAYGGSIAGASPIWIGGYLTASGGGGGGSTSLWSAADAAANSMTLTNGGLTVTPSGVAAWKSIRTTVAQSAGKRYVEFITSFEANSANLVFGAASSGFIPSSLLGSSNYSGGVPFNTAPTQVSSGFTANYTWGATFSPVVGDVISLAIDFDAGKIWLATNNTWISSSNPATATLPIISFIPATVGPMFAAVSFNGPDTGIWTLHSNAASQKYTLPAGFKAWDAP